MIRVLCSTSCGHRIPTTRMDAGVREHELQGSVEAVCAVPFGGEVAVLTLEDAGCHRSHRDQVHPGVDVVHSRCRRDNRDL